MEIKENQNNNILEKFKYENIEKNKDNNDHRKIELSLFTISHIKALILYYIDYCDLEQNVKNSKKNIKNSECYLINKTWMNEFKNFYLYDKLVKIIKNVDINSENIDKKIYDNLDEEYIKEINEKESKYNEFFKSKMKINLRMRVILDKDERDMKYYYGFDILSDKVYNLIENKSNSYIKKDYLINDEKIIFKFKGKIKPYFLVGHFDFKNHEYISEFILCHFYGNQSLDQYEYLKYNHYNELKKEKINNEIYLIKGNSTIRYRFGKIIEINSKNNELLKDRNRIEDEREPQDNILTTLNSESKNNIQFLLKLYYYCKSFKQKFNKLNSNIQNPETGYIINEDLIKKYKEYYIYNELKQFLESKKVDISSKDELDNSLEELSNKYIKEIIKKDNNPSIKDEFYNSIQKINQNLYPDNCIVLTENLINLLYNYNEKIKKDKRNIKIQYFIQNKKFFIIYNNSINIGNIDDNCIFKLKEKIQYDTKEDLNYILNEIKNNRIDNLKDAFNQDLKEPKESGEIIENKIKNNKNKAILPKNNDKLNIININDKNIPKENNLLENCDIDNMDKELKIILSMIIDSEKIKYKTKMSLNSGNLDEYYLLNYNWFRKYLVLNSVNDEIYGHLVNSVKSHINLGNIKIQNEMLIKKVILQINPNIKMKIKKEKENYYKLDNQDLFNLDCSSFIIKGYTTLKYYYNFIIISSQTMKLLNKDFSFDYDKNKFLILLGDNKAFIKRKTPNIIEICNINNNIFIPELFFYFLTENILKENLNLLQTDGYEKYSQYNLLFNNDATSPIFNKNNNSVGYAFKYYTSIKDYSIYQINEQLKTLIKVYFSFTQLKNKLNSDKFVIENFLILDKNYIQKIKELLNYNNLEKELNNNIIAKKFMNLLEKDNNNKIRHDILDDKKISLIIKNLPDEININYNKNPINNIKIEYQEIPNLIPFNNDDILFYYNNFEIVDKQIYDELFRFNSNSSLYKEKDNCIECIFIEKYILINISKINRKCTLEVCIIDDNNNANPIYLLEYDKKENILEHLNYVKTIYCGVKIFFETLDFTLNNRIEMNDENDQKVGIIYNLEMNKNINTISPSINNQNLNNISKEGNYQKSNNFIKNNMNRIPKDNFNGPNIINKEQKGIIGFDTKGIINQNFPKIYNDKSNMKKKDENNPHNNNNPKFDDNNQIFKSIIDIFPFPPKIGLQNVGATFCMNATLQCFSNILCFVNFFKFNSKVNETINKYEEEDRLCLTSSFKILIDNLWPYGNKILKNYCGKNSNNIYFIPKEFNYKISRMNDLFKSVAANDSKVFVNFIITTLQEELNEIPEDNINNNGANNQNINLYDNNEVLQNFLNNFKKKNSIISKEFYAVNHTLTKCSKCQLIKNNYQTYFFLIFPLEEIGKYKLEESQKQNMNMCQNMFNANTFLFQQNLQKMQNVNIVTLEDCFNYNEKIDTFQGQNAMYCNLCKLQLTSYYQTKLFTGPEILILVLNREKGFEINVKLEFDLFIDITNYVELKENNGWKYELIGVVAHLGEIDASEHFIAYCKSPIGGGWYQYNDELVFEVKDFKQIRDYAIPVILFYQKIDK